MLAAPVATLQLQNSETLQLRNYNKVGDGVGDRVGGFVGENSRRLQGAENGRVIKKIWLYDSITDIIIYRFDASLFLKTANDSREKLRPKRKKRLCRSKAF